MYRYSHINNWLYISSYCELDIKLDYSFNVKILSLINNFFGIHHRFVC